MKTGILTFYGADSYGAVLQAYALQQTLLKLGTDCEFVDIRMPKRTAAPQQSVPASPAMAVFAKRLQTEGQKRAALFARFRTEHLRISRPYEPSEHIADDFDLFVAGSDQIWNLQIPDADSRYFLPFARPEQRCSYAASFGGDGIPEQAKDWIAAQLSGFRAVSVRENSGIQVVKALTGRDAAVCLDPTLLLNKDEWDLLAAQEDPQPCVTLFLLKYDETLVSLARAEAEQEGLPLRIITASFMPKLGTEPWVGTGVPQWLSAIRNARCVFTNSFHGMVFSMLFERPFRVARLGGELAGRNGRIEELLQELELSSALEQVVRPDYGAVRSRMEAKKAASLAYLEELVGK